MSFFDQLFRPKKSRQATPKVENLFDDEFLRRLETLALASRKAAAGARRGDRRTKKKGSGVEFADHKSYVAGDDLRFLDVGVYQRFGKLLLRVYEEEEDQSVYLLLDGSLSMGAQAGKKWRQARLLTAALGYIGLCSLDRVAVLRLSDELGDFLPPTRGRTRVLRILRFLSALEPHGKTDLGAALRTFAAQQKRRGLAILISDLFDPHGFEQGINVLRYNRYDVCVLHIVSQDETALGLRGDLTLVDLETQVTREITVTPELASSVSSALELRNHRIERFCRSRGVAYFQVDEAAPFDDVVLRVLRQGGLFR